MESSLLVFQLVYLTWLQAHLPVYAVNVIVLTQAIIIYVFLTVPGNIFLGIVLVTYAFKKFDDFLDNASRMRPRKDNGQNFELCQAIPGMIEHFTDQLLFFIRDTFQDSENLYISFDAGQSWHAFNVCGYKIHRYRSMLTPSNYLHIVGISWEYEARRRLIMEIRQTGKIDFENPYCWKMIQKLRDVGIHVAYLR